MPLLHNHLMDSCSYVRKNTLLAAKGGCICTPLTPPESATACSFFSAIALAQHIYTHFKPSFQSSVLYFTSVCMCVWRRGRVIKLFMVLFGWDCQWHEAVSLWCLFWVVWCMSWDILCHTSSAVYNIYVGLKISRYTRISQEMYMYYTLCYIMCACKLLRYSTVWY